jgi:hypothetical protein
MALPQIEAVLSACDRRDADATLRTIEATHAANAPLQCGKSGSSFMESAVNRLRTVAMSYRAAEAQKPRSSVFAALLSAARKQQEMKQ